MAFRIYNNVQSLNSLRNLNLTQTRLGRSLEKLSSGLKVNTGKDGPAALVISEKLRAQIAGLGQAIDNSEQATSLVNYADRDLYHRAFERDESLPGVGVARGSRLYGLLTESGGHAGVALDHASLYRLAVWMDTYAHRQGAFSEAQEAELEAFRKTMP